MSAGNSDDRGPPAELCVVRHGETDWNAQGILQGSIDVPLNDTGRSQARELAAALEGSGIRAVHASTLARSRETALIIARSLRLPDPELHAGLGERHFGAIEGSAKSALARSRPELLRQIQERDPAGDFAGGETMDAFAARVQAAVHAIAARHRAQRVLVVTHGWAIDAIVRAADGLAADAILPNKPANCECLWLVADRGALRRRPAPPHAVVQ
jgi:probable phosphoglycerate mutase